MRQGVCTLSLVGLVVLLCASGSPAKRPSRVAAGITFVRVDAKTEINNAQGTKKLKINPAGTADFTTDPAEGGAQWKVHFTWKVPETIVAGENIQGAIKIGLTVSDVQPDQPLSNGINALAPDFAQQVIANYPSSASVSKSYDYKLSAGQTLPFTITIGFLSSSVVYHYQPGAARHAAKLQVEFVGSTAHRNFAFSPRVAKVASGARITLCNRGRVQTKPASLSRSAGYSTLVKRTLPEKPVQAWVIPSLGLRGLKPGACASFTVRNPTKAPLRLNLFDRLHETAKLFLTIEPES